MTRRVGLLVACLAMALLFASAGLATGPVRATLIRPVATNKGAGEHVLVAWRLRDATGHAVVLKRVTLLIICPTHDAYTKTVASPRTNGTYRVSAVVPPGGIGTLMISANKQTFPITNPIHR